MRQNSRETRLIADFSTQNLPCFFAPTYLFATQVIYLGVVYKNMLMRIFVSHSSQNKGILRQKSFK